MSFALILHNFASYSKDIANFCDNLISILQVITII